MTGWIAALPASEFDDEDILRWDHAGRTYALCLDAAGVIHCLDGRCPQDGAHLAGGLVEGGAVECPMEGCRYDLATGAPRGGPARGAVAVHPARFAGGMVEVRLE